MIHPDDKEATEARGRERVFGEICRRLCARQTVVEISRELNRPAATVYRWMRSEQFSQLLKDMDEVVWRNVMEELGDNSGLSVFSNAAEDVKEAYEALREIMADSKTSPAVRRGVANDILEMHGLRQPHTESVGLPQILTQAQIHVLQETMKQVVGHDDEPSAKDSGQRVQPKH